MPHNDHELTRALHLISEALNMPEPPKPSRSILKAIRAAEWRAYRYGSK
ncbi:MULTISPECIES: hypothetical protein [unclassified Bradyrhizobium]|nr:MULTISPECIES: hypothetical protein [unclassified Bradyrhizobium]